MDRQSFLTQKLASSISSYHLDVFLLCLTLHTCTSAGLDATEAFFSLHRYEVLEKPQYQRLQIGTIQGEESVIHGRIIGELSKVPYAEPTWLSDGYHSPYYSEVSNLYQPCLGVILKLVETKEPQKVPESYKTVL